LDYISRELDELEREDFTRLKLVQTSKEQARKEKEAEEAKAKAEAIANGETLAKTNDTDITAQFDANDDEDVVF